MAVVPPVSNPSAPIDTSGQRQAKGSSSPDSTAAEILEMYRKAKGVRERFTPDWYLNIAFFLGQQWLWWNKGRLDKPQLARWRRTPVDNRIQPIVLARVARKVKNRPAFVSTPFTADEADIDASKIGEKVLDQDWVNLGLGQALYEALQLAEVCCAGFWKVYWDSTKGKSEDFLHQADGTPLTQANGTPVKADAFGSQPPDGMTAKPVAQGDASVEVLTPFEFYPDPLATKLEECEWVIEEKVRSVEYVKARYGEELPPDAPAPIGPIESRMFASLYYQGTGSTGEVKGVKVLECWARPSSKYGPKGKRIVVAGGKTLTEEEPLDPMPYVMFSGVKVPNRFWPTSLVTQLRGPQTELNKVHAQIMENGARLGNPSLLKSRQANVYYSGIPGEEVLFDSTVTDAKPSFLEPPEMPVYVREQIQRLVESMTEISGLHEVSNATVPTGVTAASAINLLQEADDTRIGPEIQDMEIGLGEAGTKLLKLRAALNSDERLIRIAGEDGDWDIFSFRGEMLGENVNVEVQAGSAMPRSKAAKQAAMLEVLQTAFQYGVDFDPRDLRRFFKDYEVAALERLFGGLSDDEQQLQRENRQMSQGTAEPVNEWDNDAVHIEGHDEFRKSARFEQLDDATKAIFQIHIDAHREKTIQQTQLQASGQDLSSPRPGQEPPPLPPEMVPTGPNGGGMQGAPAQ